MSDATVYVYLPDDEPDSQQFNGHTFHLAPNEATKIVSPWPQFCARDIALHIVEKLGRWGVCLVSGPVKDGKALSKEDQAAVDAAELQYLKGTKSWAEEFVAAFALSNKVRTESGLDEHPEDADTKKARAWLSKYRPALIKAGLIAKG